MTERWFRWYDGTVRDGKIILAAHHCGESVCTIVGVWAALLEDAATSDPRGIATKGLEYHCMFLNFAGVEKVWNALERTGTVRTERNVQGIVTSVTILNWDKRQFETDAKDPTSKIRKDKWKQKHNASGTVRNGAERFGTPETETETETYKKKIHAIDADFESFRKSYPKRDGANPVAPARLKFLSLVKSGVDPAAIIAGARGYAAAESKNVGTPYIAMMTVFLNQRRWEDYSGANAPAPVDDAEFARLKAEYDQKIARSA